jgi:hypothetical protein
MDQQKKRPSIQNIFQHRGMESPPSHSILSEIDILQRGCPGAPKKQMSYGCPYDSSLNLGMMNRGRRRHCQYDGWNEDSCQDSFWYSVNSSREYNIHDNSDEDDGDEDDNNSYNNDEEQKHELPDPTMDPPRLMTQRILTASVDGITRPTARRLITCFSPESTREWISSTSPTTTILASHPRRIPRSRISLFPSTDTTFSIGD